VGLLPYMAATPALLRLGVGAGGGDGAAGVGGGGGGASGGVLIDVCCGGC
jgi:hypothetical protein